MIRLKTTTNIADVIDYVNSMQNDIQMIISQVMNEAIIDLQSELPSRFGNAANEAQVTLEYDGGDISINVENINPYHLYNASGESYSDVVAHIEEYLSNKMAERFRSEGYKYGN
jgi:hypothetical protein